MKSVPMYNENQVGGVLSIYTDPKTQKTGPITGAGVMLIENYFGKAAVILIQNIPQLNMQIQLTLWLQGFLGLKT